MAARKKDDALAAFTVVLEDINSRIKVVCEAQTGLRETMEARFDAVDRRFEAVDRRFDAIDRRFEGVDRRFDAADVRVKGLDVRLEGLDLRLEGVDVRLEGIEGNLALVKAAVLENSRDLKDLRVAVARKVDRDEVEAIVARALGR